MAFGRGLHSSATLLASLCLTAGAAAQPGSPGTTPTPAIPPQVTKAIKPLFNPSADGAADIQGARERARADGRNVLVLWGDNQAAFCTCLDDQLHTEPRLRALLEIEFELVYVDTGRFEKHLDLGEHYKTDFIKLGVPDLTIIDAAIDSVVAVLPGRDAITKPPIAPRCFDSETLFKFLDNGKARRPDAGTLLGGAQSKAKVGGKRVLAVFGERNCPACAAWDRAAANRETAAILDKAFVVCKIDSKRNPGGPDVIKRLSGAEVPDKPALWKTVLDIDGKVVADAGKMPAFDPAQSGKPLAAWLLTASNGKLTPEEREKIGLALATPPDNPASNANNK